MTVFQYHGLLLAALKRDGLRSVTCKIRRKLHSWCIDRYTWWRRNHEPDSETLTKQAEVQFDVPILFSVIVPVYNTNPVHLRSLAQSLVKQSYQQWEACFFDDASSRSDTRSALAELPALDARLRVTFGKDNRGIAENTNRALAMAKGDYFFFVDHDDLLASDALYTFRRKIDQTGADLLYCDEDKINEKGTRYFDPHLKPDFSPDLLRQCNYIGHMAAMKRELLEHTGGLDPAFDGSQDYDLLLRAGEKARRVEHIASVLYHWRMLGGSVSHRDGRKCLLAAQRAVQAHLLRCGLQGDVEIAEPYLSTGYALLENTEATLIWIERDQPEQPGRLRRIADDIRNQGLTLRVLTARMPGVPENPEFSGVAAEDGETLPALLNRAVGQAETPYILFLDSSLMPLTAQWARSLLGYVQRVDVGFATAAIYTRHNRLAVAGYAVGRRRIARGLHHGVPRGDAGYFRRVKLAQNVSAVPFGCCAFRKEVWERYGGLELAFPHQLFDVDLCLRMRADSLYHVYVPQAAAVWAEGTRVWFVKGDSPADEALLWRRHAPLQDPFYNSQWNENKANETLK